LLPIASLPGVNAALNATSALLLALGYFYIRSGRADAHRRCMLAALTASVLFLTSYLIYHYHVVSVPFAGRGWIRGVYFTILVSHTILAVVIVPLVLITLTRALKGNFMRHRAIARWTLPLWFYVSVTGVIVYWMLYRLGPRP
jgi:uncharacterized membrane protein YozB (DUF420 family)